MNKYEAQYVFWSSFGIPAYEENSVPDTRSITFPYITYQAIGAEVTADTFINVSIYTRSSSLKRVTDIAEKVLKRFAEGGAEIRYNGGGFFLTAENDFIQIMGDPNDSMIKRALLSLVIHW